LKHANQRALHSICSNLPKKFWAHHGRLQLENASCKFVSCLRGGAFSSCMPVLDLCWNCTNENFADCSASCFSLLGSLSRLLCGTVGKIGWDMGARMDDRFIELGHRRKYEECWIEVVMLRERQHDKQVEQRMRAIANALIRK
jgi:hypothetical protein